MTATRNKILQHVFWTIVVATVCCCIFYIWTNGSTPSPENLKIASVSTTIHVNTSLSHKEKRFPNAMIIGSAKSGTRALLEMLGSHPMIKCASKEVNYFSFHFNKGLKWYINQMPETTKNELTIEKSPRYFVTSLSPERIYYNLSKNVQFILIVRNPINRTVSHYVEWMSRMTKNKKQVCSFDDRILHPNGTIVSTVDEINVSMYDVHYQRWLKWFDKKQVLVLNGDELITNPVPLLNKVESFLNISHYFKNSMFTLNKEKGFYCWKRNATTEELKCLSKSKGRPHPTVSDSTLNKLKEFSRPHAKRFCQLADVKFNWCSL